MKIQRFDSKTVFVMSQPGNCPSLILTNKEAARLADDYHGSIATNKALLKKLSLL